MQSALVGHTGFVGGNLADQFRFDQFYNSRNIEDIAGQRLDLLVVSGMPAAKWIANGDPAGDRKILDRLVGCLKKAEARQVVVISTVDVYPKPIEVNEDSLIDPAQQQPYGRHRLMLEQELTAVFAKTLVVRLPGLFGAGLKKNAIYDLLHNNELQKVNAAGVFQFYNLARLWADIQTGLNANLNVINFATNPFSVRDMAREAFGLEFNNDTGSTAARYDMRSKHASLYGGRDGYLYDRAAVLGELREFVNQERAKL